jgi:transcriptional repressor NrdR
VRCPFCKKDNDKVVDSRSSTDATAIRRRRECLLCKRRYTTYETIEEGAIRVVKKDGSREPYDRNKLLSGVTKACEKRPVPTRLIEELADVIESEINKMFDREVTSRFIGEQVMTHLRKLDDVAYVRFASVYRDFKDVTEYYQYIEEAREKDKQEGQAASETKPEG